ncbi:HAD family hydrolase [Deferribacterales bacterium RsTz2092]|nr:hypothetical protein AGMMS49941_01790 [Deferribacterales bacterium]
MASRYSVIIYDFDGVIVNSRRAVCKYYSEMFRIFNLPVIDWESSDFGKLAYGMTDEQLFSMYTTPDTVKKMREYVLDISFDEWLAVTPLEVGVHEALTDFISGHRLAICTNRGMSINGYLEHYKLADYFSCIITSKDVSEPKPAPEGVLKILSTFGVEPASALYVGDSEQDYQAAIAAGVAFVSFGASIADTPAIRDHRELAKYL